ncbi:efflux RND transporter periplasmic adaptor subunit [Leisingera sp. D0M16]|uniref:efflux RND transporter periplasmic adaptor subunit n=1 Tax=Leisingera coralii TaxID=3351347 RepID=UPI003B7ADB88
MLKKSSIRLFLLSQIFLATLLLPVPSLSQSAPTVDVARPLEKKIVEWDEYTGRFEAVETVVLQARVSGYLDGIFFDEGQLVEKGSLLFEIDRRPFEAAVAEAEARLAAALAQQDIAQIEADRAEELLERAVGPRSEAQRRGAELAEAIANVAIAEALLQRVRLDLEFTRIYAPISGRISSTEIDVGNLVQGGSSGATALANIVTVDPIEFAFSVSEADFLRYTRLFMSGERPSSRERENPVQVRLMDDGEWAHTGRMTFVDNRIDPNSGTLLGRATLPNPDQFFQPGLFGRLRLPGSAEYTALLIPDRAIVTDQSRKIVYVVADGDVVEEKGITLGPIHEGLRVIRTGLDPGDRVIVSGLLRVRSGTKVDPTEVDLPDIPMD